MYRLRLVPEFPNKVTRRWPAIIFADKRIANVPGRIIFLIVSIITRKGKRILGAPWGTKWANIWIEFLYQPNNIKVNHKDKLNVKVKFICLVLVKI